MRNMSSKLCCIFNYAPHYRKTIYDLFDKELDVDFYFGIKLKNEYIKKIELSKLQGFRKELNVSFWGIFEYTTGWIKLALNKKYDKYIITTNYFAINQWISLLICKLLNKQTFVWMHGIKSPHL